MKKLLFNIIVACSSLFTQGMHQNTDPVTALKENIKALMSLSATNKFYNTNLKPNVIGNFYKHCDQYAKNKVLQQVIDKVSSINYQNRRLPICILIHAGASANTKRSYSSEYVLLDAVLEDDADLAALLFQHGANPNIGSAPILFHVKTTQIAQMFIANGVNLCSPKGLDVPNVLWRVIQEDTYPAELIDIYLKHGADVTELSSTDKSCLLHWLAQSTYYLQSNDNFLKKAATVLSVMKHMINATTRDGQTPLDCAEKALVDVQPFLKKAKFHGSAPEAISQLITLFKSHGGVTGRELQQQKTIPLLQEGKKVIDLHESMKQRRLAILMQLQKEREMKERELGEPECRVS